MVVFSILNNEIRKFQTQFHWVLRTGCKKTNFLVELDCFRTSLSQLEFINQKVLKSNTFREIQSDL